MLDRYRGALLGLAAGDALGTTVEFKPPGTFALVTDIIGGGPFDLRPGEWTDDTSMALCLAESLIERRGFDAKDQMDRYCRWHEEGYLSSTGLLIGALQNRQKSELLAAYFYPGAEPRYWDEKPLAPEIAAIAAGSFKSKEPPDIKGSGYVAESLEAALWAFAHSNSFHEGALLAVNLGDDADTTGAIYGEFAGAFYGAEGIPPKWNQVIVKRELIIELAERLYAF